MKNIHEYPVPCSGVKAFIKDNEGRLLILRHAVHEFTKKPAWGLPGGHIDWGEDPEEALKREAEEELGVEITIEKPVLAWNKHISEKHQTVYIGYQCSLLDQNTNFKLAPSDDAYHWMALEEFNQFFPASEREYRPAIERYFALKS